MDALPGINGPPRVRQRVDSVIAQHLSNGPFFSCARLQPTVMEASLCWLQHPAKLRVGKPLDVATHQVAYFNKSRLNVLLFN
jgi:hypothetical protein